MFPLIGLSLVFSIAVCVHVVRTGREMYWLFIILAFQPLGGIVYALINVLPDIFGGSTARQISKAARETLDPSREYRAAKAACEDTPTVRNRSRLAAAAAGLGKHDEAARLYAEAAQGIHAEDPALLLGRANALLELDRHAEALGVLEKLGQDQSNGRTPNAALALGRTYEGLGRLGEADTAYEWAAQRLPGFEGLARYAAFMARHGRRQEAEDALVEMDKRLTKLASQFRKEGRHWRDLAAKALAEG
ncbi:MAG TPA: hypothetical protein VF474_10580 [Phenylobacterium sp.]